MTKLDALRWYKSGQNPEYSLQHWWRIQGELESGVSPVDEDNTDLFEKDERNRVKVRLEPWLWGILRRHPEMKAIREEYLAIIESASEVGFERYNRDMIVFLKPWEKRGQRLIEQLARWGHLSWAD